MIPSRMRGDHQRNVFLAAMTSSCFYFIIIIATAAAASSPSLIPSTSSSSASLVGAGKASVAAIVEQQQQDDSDLVFDEDQYLTHSAADVDVDDAGLPAAIGSNRQKRYAPAALEPGDARSATLKVAATNGGSSSSSSVNGGKSKLAAHGLWSHQSKKVKHLQQARASSSSVSSGSDSQKMKKIDDDKTMTPLSGTAAAAAASRKRATVEEKEKKLQQSAKVASSSFSSSSPSKKKKIHQQQQNAKKGVKTDAKAKTAAQKQKHRMEQMMMLANDDEDMMADASGSGSGPPFEEIPELTGPSASPSPVPVPSPPQVATGRKVYRCSLLIQEPFSAALENRDSDDFEQLSDRFTAAVDQVYASSSTSFVSTTVHTFESVPGELSHIRVNFDVDGGSAGENDDDDDASAIETILRQAVRTGQIGSFYIKAESLTMRLVTGSAELPNCELQCRSGDQCVQYQQRCDGAQDCLDGTDEEDCPPEIIPPVPIPEVNCRGDIQYSCRGGVKSICDDELCDGKSDCPEGDDEEGCPGAAQSTSSTTTTAQPTTTTTTATTTRPYCQGESQLSCDGGDRCVQISAVCDGVVDCLDGTDESDCPTIAPPPPPTTTESPPPQPPAVRGCREGSEFQCDDGDCVPRSQVCDRIPDCSRGEDELNCREPCQAGEFQCKSDQLCIAIALRCDGQSDCSDSSDESGCPCTREEWQCDFGSCIDRRLRCDGKIDCPTDASDEANCPSVVSTPPPPPPTTTTTIASMAPPSSIGSGCRSDEFRCDDGSCVGSDFRCDNIPDCSDASDEDNCSAILPACPSVDQFRCGDGLCLPSPSQRCNGIADCLDSSDEADCLFQCRSGEFRCSDGTCIDARRKCDGYPDCRDRADEANCTGCLSDQFRCESSGSCIPTSQKCDGIVDCPDREDEINCLTSLFPSPPPPPTTTTTTKAPQPPYWLPPVAPVCTQYQFRCRDGTCLDSRRRCDSRPDCPDASDEDNCDCRADQFRCGSGQCIESAQRCDRIVDCPDRSDENNCGIQCQNGEFSCTSGNQCVPYSLVCDGRKDCQDFSDESNCPSNQNDELNLKTYPNDQTILQGREVVFQCRDEGPARVPVRWTRGSGLGLPPSSRDVNGRLEMPNIQPEHTGTYICEAVGYPATTPGARVSVYLKVEPFAEPTTRPSTACGVNEATCMNGECIPKTAVCDGDFDCSDQSDEMRCSLLGCQPNEYQCENKRCVLKNWRCDGDDDCGDNSDEKFCKPSPPGSPCRHDEFQCQSQNQCIPRSFHCDMELDCQDRSDEIGCSKPTILIPPPPMVMVNLATTIVINCTAVGVPTPEVVWRLNWGHVPSKCTMTSEQGFGVLTCRDSQIIDQGAYSCEAINAKGSTFAVPDCIVVVKPSADICIDEEFNSAAASPADCLPCFCFGHTMDCSSSSLYVSQLPPPTDQFQLITLRTETIRRFFLSRDLSSSATLNRPYLRSPAQGDGGIQVFRRDFSPRGEVAYFNLPPTHRGYQLLSYGGYLKYRLTFRGTGAPVRPTVPDVILRGNGITLYHDSRSSSRLQANQANEMSVRFIPDEWTKGQDGREPATRQDLMMVLQSIEFLLIRASYVENAVLDTTVSQIRMDTASEQNYNQGQAVLVEECRCPPGYIGLSCDSCAPGYTREETSSSSSRFLGRCIPATAQPSCDPTYEWTCPSDGSCVDLRRRCDGRPDCRDRSDESNCSLPSPPISPPSQCNVAGIVNASSNSGVGCTCKDLVTGQRCDLCKPNTFFLDVNNQDGCINCFCMGITKTCTASNWYRQQIRTVFTSDIQGFALTEKTRRDNIVERISVNSASREIIYKDFNRLSSEVHYWKLPASYIGDKVTSYGGSLNYTVRYVPQPGGRSSPNNAPDVDIRGNNIRLLHYRRQQQPVDAGQAISISVPLTEQHWQREDGRSADREHLLMVLADLDSILIKATYTTRTSEAALSEVSLDIAEERNMGAGQELAFAVEQCSCPRGYKGLSCEDCDTGYTRSVQGVYLGLCEPCNCNGHSNECHPDTGVCTNCRDHTTGDECELCETGYTGDATMGTSNDCRAPGGGDFRPPTSTSCSCDPRGSVSTDCPDGRTCSCKANCEGARCDRCRDGTFSLSEENPQGCISCFCSGVTRQCSSAVNLFRIQITMQVIDSQHGFTLSERNGVPVPNLRINIGQNEISHTFSSTPSRSPKLYWSLPPKFTGNKVTSYGGKLSITQRYDERQQGGSSAGSQRFADADIIITGDRITLVWINPNEIPPAQTVTFTVLLRESAGWRRGDKNGPAATREDMMQVLSNLQTIEIRATYSYSMAYTSLSNVALDTAVPYNTGLEQPRDVEQCTCPEGHKGTSCEECASGFYRDRASGGGQCRRCPCSGNEESCTQQSDGRVVCNCRQGFSGRNCEIQGGGGGIQQPPVIQQPPQQQGPNAPSIVLTVTDPRIQIAEIGSTVRFRCSGQSLVGRQVLLRWGKEGAPLPPGRAQDDRRGVLIISDVRHSDSGTYVCSGQDGLTVVTETVVLNVGGGQNPTPPLVAVEPRFVEAQIGQSIQVRCTAEGHPQPTIQWLSAREIVVPTSDGILKIASVRKSDEGEYTCMATNPSGSSTGRVTVFVRSGSSQQGGPSEVPVQVVVSPQDTTARRGDVVRLTCRAEIIGDRIAPVIRWTKMDGAMPSGASGQNSANGVLILSNVSPSDTGIYVCTVTASSGAIQQSQARLTVLSYNAPPTVRIEPDRQTISQGTSAELRCLAVGEPSPSIRWTKVGEDFSNNVLVTGPVLRVVNAMVRDRGMYICSAENSGGLAQASAIVEVERREPPAVELYPTTKQTVVQGGSALFQCRVTAGIPTPRAKWSRVDGRPMPSNVEELDGGVIRFNRVTGINEQGQYVCTAENDVGTITGVATLTIQSIPVVSVTPAGSPIKAKVGQRLRLECRAQGDPAPSVSWRRLRTGFLYDAIDASNKETQQVAVYDINRVTQADEGTYSCTARNEAGLTEERLQIIVEPSSNRGDIEENENEIDGSDGAGGRDASSNTAGGNLMGGDDVFRVPIGGTAEMRCILQGSQQGIYLDWVRSDGGSMPADRDIRDGVLYIRNVKQDAAGVYSCIGISAQGATVFSADRRLEIVAPPRIQLEPQRQVVRPGDQAEIRCVASGDQPITINWFKIDGTLPPAVLVNNGQIQFRGIAVSDAGRYICSARNSVGQAEAVAEVIVNEDMTVSVGREQTVNIGSTVELSCNLAPGTGAARVQWSRDRGFLPPTAFKKRDNKLHLANVQPEDAGRYQCEVTTAQGVASEYVLLKIDRAPSLAVQVTPNRESVRRGDNLEVRCDASGDPSALVSWRRIGGSLSRNAQVLGNLLKITDVRPENGGVYRCQVLSKAGNVDENYILSIQADSEYPHDMASTVETRTAPVQSVVVMECRTDLRQPVKFTWSRQGGILPKAARVEGSKLTIPEVRAEDAGTYVCTARSADEIVDIPTVLVVTGVVPYFAQAPLSYMQMPTLPDAYMQFDIEISFKPESPDGLILYNGQQAGGSGDFISFGLSNGHPEFRFDVGAGPAIIKADKAIEMGKWHTVKLGRNKKDGTMLVDDGESGPFTGSVGGRFLGLDLLEPLYLGGVPNFRSIHKLSGFNRGFVGCIGRLVVGTTPSELVRDATNSRGITTCETCALNPCEHGGVCQEAYTEQGYSCICPSGFSGLNCDQIGETCYPGACGAGGRCVNQVGGFECLCPLGTSGSNCEKEMVVYEPAFTEGSYIAYPSPSKAALRKMRMAMRIKPRQVKDSLLVYCAQTEEGQGDFSSISIKDKRIEFRFDSGSGPAILKSDREIRAGEWVHVTADRSFRDGVLIVNEGAEVRGKSPGSTRGLNLNTKLFVGGWDRQRVRLNPGVNVTSSFDGCLSQFEVQGMEIDLVNSVIDSANVEDCGGASACERKPCHNGGQCTETGSQPSDYVCQCEEGFSGRNCEIEADLCQVIRPCQNSGTCVGTYNAYKCNCPIGFGGTNCERKVDVAEEAFFQGDSYVEVDKSIFPHVSSTAAEIITVEFSTLEPNGILFWHGQKADTDGRGQDYVALTVVDGRLEFSYELGSGSVQITTPVRVDDGKRHRAVARRTSREGSLELDSIIQENGRSPEGVHQMLNTKGNIYIGGLPNADGMTAGRYIHGLKGCIHQLKIQDSGALNFQRAAVSAVNVVPCSSEEIKLLMGEDEDDDFEPPAN